VVTDPQDYPAILEEMRRQEGRVSRETSLDLARKAFCLTHTYDGNICDYLTGVTRAVHKAS
jgi:phosphoribosylaminoimidazolecarboxamide formyltransferase / IMP cyclohydrolase